MLFYPFYKLVKRFKPEWCKTDDIDVSVYGSEMQDEGNALFRFIFPPFFKKIKYEISSKEKLNKAAKNGVLVYVMHETGQLEVNYFQHLLCSEGLPLASFINGISLRRFMKKDKLKAVLIKQMETLVSFGGITDVIASGELEKIIFNKKSILLSLVPSELEEDTILLSYSQKLLFGVISAQNKTEIPVYFVPLEFVWDRRPAKEKRTLFDVLFGEKERPGSLRKIVLFWRNYRNRAVARVGEPILLNKILEQEVNEKDDIKARRLGEKLLDALHLERRTITGPPIRSKQWFVERVLVDDKFQSLIYNTATELNKSTTDLQELAEKYLREIIAGINYTYIEIGVMILKWAFHYLYDGFSFNEDGLNNVKKLYATKPVIFVPNHKSHLDYLILSYILHDNYMTPPNVAAGINLSFWPLGSFFRRCGAYFIRRSFQNNKLYSACVETYLRILLEEGYSQEFFIEGGRSRTGKLMPARHGLLRMIMRAVDDSFVKEILFVPVSFTYDRVIEQKGYEKELSGGSKTKEGLRHLVGLLKYLKPKKSGLGKIYVNFGEPVSYSSDAADIKSVGSSGLLVNKIYDDINQNTVITPLAILASALLSQTKRAISLQSVLDISDLYLEYMIVINAKLADSVKMEFKKAIVDGLADFVSNRLVIFHSDVYEPFYSIDDEKRLRLEYYKNSCLHFFVPVSIVANSLKIRLQSSAVCSIKDCVDDYLVCKRMLKYEFNFRYDENENDVVERVLDYFVEKGILKLDKGQYSLASKSVDVLTSFAGLTQNFFESLKIALSLIKRNKFEITDQKEITRKMIATGENMFLLGHIKYREAVSKANFINALMLFTDLGLLEDHSKILGAKGKKLYTSKINKELLQELQVQLEILT